MVDLGAAAAGAVAVIIILVVMGLVVDDIDRQVAVLHVLVLVVRSSLPLGAAAANISAASGSRDAWDHSVKSLEEMYRSLAH